MNLPKSLTTVTSFSKIMAGVLFVSLPIAGFYLGMEYQKGITPIIENNNNSKIPIVKIPSPTTDPTKNWNTYINNQLGFSFQYPPSFELTEYEYMNEERTKKTNTVEVRIDSYDEIIASSLDDSSEAVLRYGVGYDSTQFKEDIGFLRKGEYGSRVDFSYEDSQRVINLGKVNTKSFVVLGRFDSCDITFERKAVFYPNDKNRVTISVYGVKDNILKEDKDYFENEVGNAIGWKNCNHPDKGYGVHDFYQDLINHKTSKSSQEWYSSFDQILSTFRFL